MKPLLLALTALITACGGSSSQSAPQDPMAPYLGSYANAAGSVRITLAAGSATVEIPGCTATWGAWHVEDMETGYWYLTLMDREPGCDPGIRTITGAAESVQLIEFQLSLTPGCMNGGVGEHSVQLCKEER